MVVGGHRRVSMFFSEDDLKLKITEVCVCVLCRNLLLSVLVAGRFVASEKGVETKASRLRERRLAQSDADVLLYFITIHQWCLCRKINSFRTFSRLMCFIPAPRIRRDEG